MMEYAYIDCGSNDDLEGLLEAFARIGGTGVAARVTDAIRQAFAEAAEEDGEDYPPVSDVINGAIIPAYEASGYEVLVIDYELDNGYIVVVRY